MALLHPHHSEPPPTREGPHPALCLMMGFGVIVLGATIVHIVFNILV